MFNRCVQQVIVTEKNFVFSALGLNVYSMLKHEALVLTLETIKFLEDTLLWHDHRYSPLYPFKLPYSDLPWQKWFDVFYTRVYFSSMFLYCATIKKANTKKDVQFHSKLLLQICKSLKLIIKSLWKKTIGQIIPDLPAKRRAFLFCRHSVGVGHEDSSRFRLKHKTQCFKWEGDALWAVEVILWLLNLMFRGFFVLLLFFIVIWTSSLQ